MVMDLSRGEARLALLDFAERTIDELLDTTNMFYRAHPQTEHYERATLLARAAQMLSSDQVSFLLGVALLRLADDGRKRG